MIFETSLPTFFFFPQVLCDLDFNVADGGGREVPLSKRSRNSSVHGLAGINQPRDTSVLVKTWKVLNF